MLSTVVAIGAGCAHEDPLPPAAEIVGSGPGQLPFTPYANGKVYLYDSTAKKTIFSAGVLRGDSYLADPARDLIEVSGKQLEHSNHLSSDHAYIIYFERSY
jgi:hypothetical protein